MEVRRFVLGDEKYISKIIKKCLLTENINDYPIETINYLIKTHDEKSIIDRSEKFHCYTFLDNNKIIGVGMVGPYKDSKTDCSFYTIFRDPEYKGKGVGRLIIETLENDELCLSSERTEIRATITAIEFYKHFGYKFTENGNIIDNDGMYHVEKYKI